jgi:hypothetical protein
MKNYKRFFIYILENKGKPTLTSIGFPLFIKVLQFYRFFSTRLRKTQCDGLSPNPRGWCKKQMARDRSYNQ